MAAQRTPLYDVAIRRGASFGEWNGWELPRVYDDGMSEYMAAMEGAALYDSSYNGRLKATGEDVLDLIDRISTNEVLSLQPGQGAPTVLTTDRGRILDLITVLNMGDHVLLLTSPQTREAVIQWIDKYTFVEDLAIEDVTSTTAELSVMGPEAQALLNSLVDTELGSFSPLQSAHVAIAGVTGYVVRRDLVGLPRFQVILQEKDAEKVWQEVIASGAVPIGTETYEVLRVENGAPEYDSEMGERYNPLETGLWGSISFTKGCYIGQEVIARLDTYQKIQRHLVFLSFSTDAQVEKGTKLVKDGKEVGHVTSVVRVPTTGQLTGLGYVRKEAAETNTRMDFAGEEGSWAKVEASALPFGPGE